MTKFSIIYSDRFLNHKTGDGHPECPDRLISIVKQLKNSLFSSDLKWIEPTKIKKNELLKIHSSNMIEKVQSVSENGGGFLDADTPVCAESFDIALLCAGAWINGLNEILNGSSNKSF